MTQIDERRTIGIKSSTVAGEELPVKGALFRLDETAAPLLASGTYATSPGIDVSDYSHIVGTCFASHNGTLFPEFSPDNTDWDGQESRAYIAGEKLGYKAPRIERYFRIRFVNDATDQTTFRLTANGTTIG